MKQLTRELIMKKRKIMILQDLKNKVLFLLSVTSFTIYLNAQPKHLDIELYTDNGITTLKIKNNTMDTIIFRGSFTLEQKDAKSHIISYKKNQIKDSIFYSRGAIWEYFNNEIKTHIQLKSGSNFIKISPQTIQEYPFSYFNKGTYYLEIQTFYIYRKKYHFLNVVTKEICVE